MEFLVNNNRIILNAKGLNFVQAKEECEELGGNVSSVFNQQENDIILNLCQRSSVGFDFKSNNEGNFNNPGCWIGMNNLGAGPDAECGGPELPTDFWDDGSSTIDFQNFAVSEAEGGIQPDNNCPSNHPEGHHCLALLIDPISLGIDSRNFSYNPGEWDDDYCGSIRPSICKVALSGKQLDPGARAVEFVLFLVLGISGSLCVTVVLIFALIALFDLGKTPPQKEGRTRIDSHSHFSRMSSRLGWLLQNVRDSIVRDSIERDIIISSVRNNNQSTLSSVSDEAKQNANFLYGSDTIDIHSLMEGSREMKESDIKCMI